MAWLENYPREYYKKYEKVDVKKKEKVAKNDVERRRYKCFLCERYALLIHFIKCFKD